MPTMTPEQIEAAMKKANEVKAIIDTTIPVTKWGMTTKVWAVPHCVRVYVNDKKAKAAAILTINADCSITPAWQPGHSMTRNEIKAALGL